MLCCCADFAAVSSATSAGPEPTSICHAAGKKWQQRDFEARAARFERFSGMAHQILFP